MPAKSCREILNRFRLGELSTIVSVDQLNEGIDMPHADVIVFLRSTVSPTVFYQQLGRGLRLHEGKEYATVLDFVGNYERLMTVADLRDQINTAGDNNSNDKKEHFVLNIDATQFKDQKIDIIDVLNKIDQLSWGWSDEELIKQLQALKEELGRVPTWDEFNAKEWTASSTPAVKRFGSWKNFVTAAGCEVIDIDTSEDGLIKQLQMLKEELGRVPTKREFDAKEWTASGDTAAKRFGSWKNFLEAAGLKKS